MTHPGGVDLREQRGGCDFNGLDCRGWNVVLFSGLSEQVSRQGDVDATI